MKRGAGQNGFTLVELLVALTITAVIAAVMLTLATGLLNLWRRAQENLTTDAAAELIFDYLERDLQAAILRTDEGTGMACSTFDDALSAHGWVTAAVLKPAVARYVATGSNPSIVDARFSRSGHWLRFITTPPGIADESGVPVAVSYQVVRRSLTGASPPEPESIRYSLFRAKITGKATLTGGYNIASHEAGLAKPDAAFVVGTNVVDFGIWLYGEVNGVSARIFPESGVEATYAAGAGRPPAYADVMIRLLTEEGAAKISALERGISPPPPEFDGGGDEWWWSLVERHSRVYVRRIRIQGVSL